MHRETDAGKELCNSASTLMGNLTTYCACQLQARKQKRRYHKILSVLHPCPKAQSGLSQDNKLKITAC